MQGNLNLSETSCQEMSKFLPDKYKHRCELCKSYPINVNNEEALGQRFLRLDSDVNFDKIFEGLKNENKELMVSFKLTEKDLNRKVGDRIKGFLDRLEKSNLRYVLSRPLPRCLGFQTRPSDPKNCFECRELFTIEDCHVNYCEPSGGLSGWNLDSLKGREQIYEYFEIKNKEKKMPSVCINCLFRMRKQCDGLCFRK